MSYFVALSYFYCRIMKEHQLQQAIFVWHWNNRPQERGLLFMVQNTATDKRKGALLKGIGLVPGVSDLIYLRPNSSPLFIELKTETGKQSAEQIKWQQTIEAVGYEYKIIRSLDEAINIFVNFDV